MLTFFSFLQAVFHFVRSLAVKVTKKMYRTAVVLTTGLADVTVVTFNSGSFGGGGRNALAAFRDAGDEEEPQDAESEEIDANTEAKIQVGLTVSNERGQQLLGSLVEKEVRSHMVQEAAEIEVVKKEVLMQAQESEKEQREKNKRERAVIPYTDQDYEVFLRIVQAEAGICDEKGKILVANVIINRVKSPEFPDNITDVVYQRRQFSPVSNGSINRVKVTEETIECVDRALAGEDYSQGALYFMYRGGSQSNYVNWFDGQLTPVLVHERHEFFK